MWSLVTPSVTGFALKAISHEYAIILASYGALVVIFPGRLFAPVCLVFTPLASSRLRAYSALLFAFGLSMDYEVFLLSRVQEAFWQTGDNTRSVALGLQRSGVGDYTSAAVIVVVVSAVATADMILASSRSGYGPGGCH